MSDDPFLPVTVPCEQATFEVSVTEGNEVNVLTILGKPPRKGPAAWAFALPRKTAREVGSTLILAAKVAHKNKAPFAFAGLLTEEAENLGRTLKRAAKWCKKHEGD